jgi:hypothetical protein
VVPPAALPRGTVVEFRDGAAPQRAKLTWISPQRTTYVFTSSQSGARSLSGTALSEALASGAVSVVQGEPTAVERALAAVAR